MACSATALPLRAAEPEAPLNEVQRGQAVDALGTACHDSQATGAPNPGPNLRGILGRPSTNVARFRYSRALRNVKLVWTAENLDAFLADPQAAGPGNTMPFPGIPDAEGRRDLLAFLRTIK